jgi:large subunit ribosomal protein L10
MVKGGTIHVKKETMVVKKGDEITRQIALVLSRLNLNPMEIGLNLYAAYDNGLILKEADLNINLRDTLAQVQTAFANALKLSLKIAYPTTQNMTMLIQKAVSEARSLILSSGIITKDTISDTLAKAYSIGLSLENMILKVNPNALMQDVKEKVEQKEITEAKQEKEEKKGKPEKEKKEKPKEEKKEKPKKEKTEKPKEEKKKK